MALSPPLDLAAQLTLILWTLTEDPADSIVGNAIIESALALAKITSLTALTLRKAQGLSIFAQIPVYPYATDADVRDLIQQIDSLLANFATITIPVGEPVPYNTSEWAPITTTGADVSIAETMFNPLDAIQIA